MRLEIGASSSHLPLLLPLTLLLRSEPELNAGGLVRIPLRLGRASAPAALLTSGRSHGGAVDALGNAKRRGGL